MGAGAPVGGSQPVFAPPPEVLSITGECQPDTVFSESLQRFSPTFAFDVDPFCVIWADNTGVQPDEYLITLRFADSGEVFEHRVEGHLREFVFPEEQGVRQEDIDTCTPRSDWNVLIFAVTPESNVVVAGYGMGGRCDVTPGTLR